MHYLDAIEKTLKCESADESINKNAFSSGGQTEEADADFCGSMIFDDKE